MGMFDRLFRRPSSRESASGAWQTLTAYRPAFTSWNGALYESELIRAAVDAIARSTAKLEVTFNGSALPRLHASMRPGPNSWQTWSQFLYRLRVILEMNGTAFIVPVLDEYGQLTGYFPVLPTSCEIVDVASEPWLRYTFKNGKKAAMEMSKCGVLTKHQYKDDIFGTDNSALSTTMSLLDMQSQGIVEGVKNGATFRFAARLNNFSKPEDLAKERIRFNKENLQDESGGILLFPNTYTDIKQLDQKPYVVDADQQKLIQTNVFNYFGVNEDVLQNKCVGDAWNAFYEGCIEPFALQLSEVMTRMTYTPREIANGNAVFATANRLQYMSNQDKLNVSSQLLDRGILSINDVRAIWNLPPVEGGDVRVVLAEYVNANDQTKPAEEGDVVNDE